MMFKCYVCGENTTYIRNIYVRDYTTCSFCLVFFLNITIQTMELWSFTYRYRNRNNYIAILHKCLKYHVF